jgi:hypothetical protein
MKQEESIRRLFPAPHPITNSEAGCTVAITYPHPPLVP